MRKLLLFIALGIVMLSYCNNGQTKGTVEEIDSIALRAKTDTILSFNGVALGDTIEESLADSCVSGYDYQATVTVDKWTYNVEYMLDGNIIKSVKSKKLTKVNFIGINLGNYLYNQIEAKDFSRLVKLYTSRYGTYSYYDTNDGDTPAIFPNDKVDSLSHTFYLKEFVSKGKGRIIWEWANCKISMSYDPLGICSIEYSTSGAKDRLKEEKKLESQAKKQDI